MTQRLIEAKAVVDRVAPRLPAISADRTLVAFEAALWGYKGKSATRAIWVSRNRAPARKFTSGAADDCVHVTQGAEMYRALKTLKVPVEFVRYPREPHGFKERNHQIDLLTRIGAWFEKWLAPEGES